MSAGIKNMQTETELKTFIHQVADQLPQGATLDDAIYRLVERREIEQGLSDSEAGRTTPIELVMKEFGIEPLRRFIGLTALKLG
jgi:predicted transcriptional regulator